MPLCEEKTITEARTMDKSELIDMEYDGRVNHTTEGIMHRLTATNTPMVRYTRTISPSYTIIQV